MFSTPKHRQYLELRSTISSFLISVISLFQWILFHQALITTSTTDNTLADHRVSPATRWQLYKAPRHIFGGEHQNYYEVKYSHWIRILVWPSPPLHWYKAMYKFYRHASFCQSPTHLYLILHTLIILLIIFLRFHLETDTCQWRCTYYLCLCGRFLLTLTLDELNIGDVT